MNEQTPTWSCPVCYRRIEDWEDLFVDEYFMEMLHNTPKHIDSVRVEPNGHITIIDENPDLADEESEEEEELIVKNEEKEVTTILLDDDDDEVEAVEKRNDAPEAELQEAAISNDTIPKIASTPEAKTATPEVRANTPQERIAISEDRTATPENDQPPKKRQKMDFIDLTLDSGDEDDAIQQDTNDEVSIVTKENTNAIQKDSNVSKENNDSSSKAMPKSNGNSSETNHNTR